MFVGLALPLDRSSSDVPAPDDPSGRDLGRPLSPSSRPERLPGLTEAGPQRNKRPDPEIRLRRMPRAVPLGDRSGGRLLVALFWLDFDRIVVAPRRRSARLTDAYSTVAVTAASRTAESAAPAAPTASSLTRASAAVWLVRGVAFVHR